MRVCVAAVCQQGAGLGSDGPVNQFLFLTDCLISKCVNITPIQTQNMLTVLRQVSGLQELGGKGAVRVLVRLLVARLPVFPVAASKGSLLGGAGRDLPASALDEQHQ